MSATTLPAPLAFDITPLKTGQHLRQTLFNLGIAVLDTGSVKDYMKAVQLRANKGLDKKTMLNFYAPVIISIAGALVPIFNPNPDTWPGISLFAVGIIWLLLAKIIRLDLTYTWLCCSYDSYLLNPRGPSVPEAVQRTADIVSEALPNADLKVLYLANDPFLLVTHQRQYCYIACWDENQVFA